MKQMILAISGVIFAWAIISFFTENWEIQGIVALILGIILGYMIRKNTENKRETNYKNN